jgi:hypothetical protein
MPVTTPTAITGKKVTFEFKTISGTAQVTTASIEESADSETIQTLGGSVSISNGVESSVSCDFLFDGNQANGGFYGALKSALVAEEEAAITIEADGANWTGQAIVTSLSAEFPADGASTCSAEFTISGDFPFTAPTAA